MYGKYNKSKSLIRYGKKNGKYIIRANPLPLMGKMQELKYGKNIVE